MGKEVKEKIKARSKNYEPKVKFEGSFEDMVKISTTGAGSKQKEAKHKK
jgi:hypothetical protein